MKALRQRSCTIPISEKRMVAAGGPDGFNIDSIGLEACRRKNECLALKSIANHGPAPGKAAPEGKEQ